jgi:AcrR family transcriptional regulator
LQKLNDARSARSQQALRRSLLDLMTELPFDQVSLRAIIARAEVSAPTFYRHYPTKEALLADIASDEIRTILARPVPGDPPSLAAGERIVAIIDGRRPLWRTLLGPGALPIMREAFIRYGEEMARRGPRFHPRYPSEVMAAVVASGLFEIIAWWLRQPDDYPVGDVADLLALLVIDPATRPPRPPTPV